MARRLSRRAFLQSIPPLCAAPMVVPSSALGRDGATAPSERVTMGFIGVGRQCYAKNIPLFVRTPGVQALAVCDVDRWRLERAPQQIEAQYKSGKARGKYSAVDTYVDYRDLLARDDVDAVMISTPDHWHARIALDAMKAGKDVALEKPIQRTIAEGRRMVDAAARYKRIFRVDSEFRSGRPAHWATSIVRNGYIGKVKRVVAAVPESDVGCPPQAEMPVPPELDYERWQGPAPRAPYTLRRVHERHTFAARPGWMRHLFYCDGMITNWSTHLNNGALWATGLDRTGPVRIEGTGLYPERNSFWNVLLKFNIRYQFADGLDWTLKTEKPYFLIEGDEGWVRAGFTEMDAEPKSLLTLKLKPTDTTFRLKSEKQDFIDSVRSRQETLEPAEVGHRVTSMALLGHIAIQLGRPIHWDPRTESFPDDTEANSLCSRPIHQPRLAAGDR